MRFFTIIFLLFLCLNVKASINTDNTDSTYTIHTFNKYELLSYNNYTTYKYKNYFKSYTSTITKVKLLAWGITALGGFADGVLEGYHMDRRSLCPYPPSPQTPGSPKPHDRSPANV